MNFFSRILTIIALTIQVVCPIEVLAQGIKPEILEKTRKAIVSIDSRISVSAYNPTGNMKGTGFIADKKNGLLVTNAHVAVPASVGSYFVTFANGKQTEAKVFYCDTWQDYAIMKVTPSEIPADSTEVKFTDEEPRQNQNVFIIGNNEAQDFSFHTGYLSNLYDINGSMPQQTYVVNLNTRGGSSGSPLLNSKGEAIGLNYGGSDTYGLSLKGAYVIHALEAFKTNQLPSRKHIGVITEVYSLDKANNHRAFPKDVMENYIKNHPDARNKVIAVKNVLTNSPAEAFLLPGDIIWQIDDLDVIAELFTLDNAMNLSQSDKVKLTIYRDGQKLDVHIPLYDVNKHQIKKLVEFAGATIFEADDFVSAKSGIPLGAVTIANIQQGRGMSVVPQMLRLADNNPPTWRMNITALDRHPITNLSSLIATLPSILSKKFITINFVNYQPYFEPFAGIMQTSHSNSIVDITLDALDVKPRVMKFSHENGDWSVEEIKEVRDQ